MICDPVRWKHEVTSGNNQDLLPRILPEGVITLEGDPRAHLWDMSALFPEERAYMERAVGKRCREFTAGRLLARAALDKLGIESQPIRRDPYRSPVWPSEVVGSISHTESWCAVAVARAHEVLALGIDVENDAPLSASLFEIVCVPEEMEWLASHSLTRRGALAKILFSVKESAFKAQYPLTQSFLDFHAMAVEVDLMAGTWRAAFQSGCRPAQCPWNALVGQWVVHRGLVATAAVALRRDFPDPILEESPSGLPQERLVR